MLRIEKIMKNIVLANIFMLLIFFVSACGNKEVAADTNDFKGEFIFKDGVETYQIDGQVIKNRLIEDNGKLYYVDENGHKAKDTWAVVDNDGHYGYFGSLGDLVVGKIRTIGGKDYYFDENGVLYQDRSEQKVKNIDGVDYIANRNGELRLASAPVNETTEKKVLETKKQIVQQTVATTFRNQQVAQQQTVAPAEQVIVGQAPVSNAQTTNSDQTTAAQTTQQTTAKNNENTAETTTEAPFANAINVAKSKTEPDEFGGPGIGLDISSPTAESNKNTKTKAVQETTKAQSSSEVKILRTEKITDTVEGDDYDCSVVLLKPIMNGEDAEETENINSCIEDLMDAFMDEVHGDIEEFDTFPKSVTFTTAKLGTVNTSRIVIDISGNIKPKSGSSKEIKYRLIYDRKDINMDIQKTQ